MAIVKVPDAILTTPSKSVPLRPTFAKASAGKQDSEGRVEKIDKKVLDFISEMEKMLVGSKNPKGVGLAAPQAGRGLRIFITRPQAAGAISVFINPEIIGASKEKTEGIPGRDNKQSLPSGVAEGKFEGCLSIPNVWGIVHRHHMVKLSFQTADGRQHRRTFTGFVATIIQHEMDHINGILFTQRVLEQKKKLYKITGKDKEGKDKFEEIEV